MEEQEKETITQEELKRISEAAQKRNLTRETAEKAVQAIQAAEKAVQDDRLAQLEYQVVVQHIFIKYGLTFSDRIDDANGVITRNKKEAV